MEKVVGPRMIRKSNELELVVQHRVFSTSMRATTQGKTHIAGNPEIHTHTNTHYVQRNRNLRNGENLVEL